MDTTGDALPATLGRPQRVPLRLGVRTARPEDEQSPRSWGSVVVGMPGFEPHQPVQRSNGASTGGRVQLSAKKAAWNVDVAWLTGEVQVRRGEVAP